MSNVKAGDLCVQVKSVAGNEGAICTAIRPLGIEPIFRGYRWGYGYGVCWLVEYQRPIKDSDGDVVKVAPCPEAWLRPILPPPGTVTSDEVKELYAPKAKETA